ncbi:MAG: twin-arginine translocation signal domain-containing protein, partial [Gemmatimonadetes bacterium]|nr:twin-arginine translocation signal domain-containing protein [Gemmatimonadota bacterium]
MTTRRDFLIAAGLSGVAAGARISTPIHAADGVDAADRISGNPASPQEAARDERYWRRVAGQYRIARRPINLEAGYYGIMAR